MEVPSLQAEAVLRPALEPIPSFDGGGLTASQKADLQEVLKAYNGNFGKLVVYAEKLERYIQVQKEYIDKIAQ